MKTIFFLISLYFFNFGCSNSTKVKNLETKYLKQQDSAKLNCYSKFDTILPNKDYIKYKSIDSTIKVEIQINGIAKLLDYSFICEMPKGLVPKYYSNTSNCLLLYRGYGFSFREIIVCDAINDSIKVNSYETELTQNSKDVFILKKSRDKRNVYILNRLSTENNIDCKIPLPKEYQDFIIEKSTVYDNHIILFFTNKRDLSLLLPKIQIDD